MTKKEFLDKLGEALLENMDITEAMSHVQYYKEYIEGEVSKGKNESEVVAALQSPRLIAKNIIMNGDMANKYSSDVDTNNKSKTKSKIKESSSNNDNKKGMSFSINGKPINNTALKIILFVVAILLVAVVLAVVGVVTWLFFKFVLPIVFILMIVGLIKGIFFKGK